MAEAKVAGIIIGSCDFYEHVDEFTVQYVNFNPEEGFKHIPQGDCISVDLYEGTWTNYALNGEVLGKGQVMLGKGK